MNTKIIPRAIAIAYALCPVNRELRCSHVSFLVKGGKILHIGWNKNKTHPLNLRHPYHDGTVGLHAEMDVCIKSGLEDLSNFDLVVIRIDREGKITNSKPCSGCQSVIKQFGIRETWFSNSDGMMEKMN